jgi:uncharacterized protein
MPSRSRSPEAVRVGLVSDTHNLLRPEVLDYLRGSHHIVHAGDICGDAVLQSLAQLAPLTAVRGNNDHGRGRSDCPRRSPWKLRASRSTWSTT